MALVSMQEHSLAEAGPDFVGSVHSFHFEGQFVADTYY
jgi:hypothetical protein